MKVIVADDHALVREGIAHTLKTVWDPVEVFEAHDGASLLKVMEQHGGADIVLMDLFMPETDGFSLLSQLCNQYPDTPIVILSASENAQYMRKAIDLGASGYVPKSLSREVMLGALQLVRSGGIYIPPSSLITKSATAMDGINFDSLDDSELAEKMAQLTGRQQQVLKLLTQGMTNKEIATELGLSEYTIKIHVTGIFKSLNVSNRTQAVILARKMGFGPAGDDSNNSTQENLV